MILDKLKYKFLKNYNEIDYRGIAYHSDKVGKDYIFVAIKGYESDGHDYIEAAISKGAKLIVCERFVEIKHDINVILVEDSREALSIISSNFYGHPQKSLTIIGVTGTNGKTTTSYLIYKSLGASAYIGTIGYYINDEKFSSNLTTPESLDLIIFFIECLKKGIKYVVMEVSSHSLILKRVNSLKFKIGIFTNLTKDHLNIHKDMETYFKSKLLLLNLIDQNGFVVSNVDDDYFKDLKGVNVKTISVENGDITGKIIKYENLNSMIEINYSNNKYIIISNLILKFNLYNIMAAFQSLLLLGFTPEYIVDKIQNVNIIPGRLNLLSNENKKVVIDFAHSPDSMKKVTEGLKEIFKEVIVIFGSGGGRDESIRADFAKAAAYNCSFIILTSDNPRDESVSNIINMMEEGLISINFTNYIKMEDREKAIKYGIKILKQDQVLLVAGKGHQNYEIVKGMKKYFNEYEIIKKELENYL